MKYIPLITAALLCVAGPSWAQTSAADIAAMVDEKMDAIDEYAALLNDPDPERSLAAMQIMIGLEDEQVSRMALQHGLTSTSPAVRRAALKAYFDSGPVLDIFIDGSSLDLDSFTGSLNNVNGTVDGQGTGFVSHKVGGFDDANGCYDYHASASYCLVTLSESNVAINLWQRWTPLTLNAEGVLTGMVQVGRMTPSVPVSIPVRP
ncbi:HEAT repeat domain-containing protein [Flavimaricola marinus]|uniref:Uncharacterized protein n=1 Tax=Flavimaricola marinus TaxID=1819565 RepID=A0A238LEF9_9RHOB|nr:HEAT repeat domain-containing protein [Flavimaricola marinus]SMY08011.1 hypothetical protein LOM8899_02157 [Flavimaricola marinus]